NARDFHGPAMFARTTDGGKSWEPARAIYDPGRNLSTVGNQIVVQPDGTLLDFFTEFTRNGPRLSFVRSTDKGATWSGVHPVFPDGGGGVYDPEQPRPIRSGGSLADVTVDPHSGALYAVWQAPLRSSQGGTPFSGIFLAQSTDGGL